MRVVDQQLIRMYPEATEAVNNGLQEGAHSRQVVDVTNLLVGGILLIILRPYL